MADVYVLSLLHFNLQYCAGGLDGLLEGWPTDEVSVEDQIVVESFVPVLELLEAHPGWQMDLELQAYMVEVLAERHPETLGRLRVLADAGQVELVSWHWSDQLWTAFPWRDQQASLDLTAEVFAAHDLPLSGVVFTQEGQFGPGMIRRMPEHGYDVAVLPKNLARYLWGAAEAPLYTTDDGVTVVVGGEGYTTADFTVGWHFLNDGELYATNEMNCYLGAAFVADPEAVAEREADLLAAEAAGGRIVSVGTYVSEVGATATTPLPPVLDGTWQPDDTENLGLWMGDAGLWGDTESDNGVRTANVRASRAVRAAEAVAGADAALVREAWRELLLGEVSDATGWNPYVTEVAYGLDHSAAAEALASEALAGPCTDAAATTVRVDLSTGEVAWDATVEAAGGEPVDAPFPMVVSSRGAMAWTSTADADVTALAVTFVAGDDAAEAVFPWDGTVVAAIPALLDEVVAVDVADLVADDVGLPLPAGLVRLSEGLWLVAELDTVHLAARHSRGGTIGFRDETSPGEATWRFLVVEGDEARAVAVAKAENLAPTVTLACPPRAVAELPDGCGCGTGIGTTGLGALLGLAAALRRRRG